MNLIFKFSVSQIFHYKINYQIRYEILDVIIIPELVIFFIKLFLFL